MRLPELDPDNLTPEQQAVQDAIRSGPRGSKQQVGLIGPYAVWTRVPAVGMATQALGAAVRFSSTLPENIKEVAICTVGAACEAKFEFAAHEHLAMVAGVAAEPIEQLRKGEAPGFTGDEAIAHRVADQLMKTHRLTDEVYADAVRAFGEEQTVELVTIIGYYSLVAFTLNAFEVPLLPGMDDPFPQHPG